MLFVVREYMALDGMHETGTVWLLASNRYIGLNYHGTGMGMGCLQCFDTVGWAAGRASGL